jgi:hypothetical protein
MKIDWKNPDYLRNVYLVWLAAIVFLFVYASQVHNYSNPVGALFFIGIIFSMPVLLALNLVFGIQLARSHKKSILWTFGILCFGAITIPVLLYVVYKGKKK